ncbi:MAG: TIGR00159 family protein [Candidatus Omnitrophica bacterium]|nr:TIGR00159 family protein [Candidatus Omnitrophota bacterium]
MDSLTINIAIWATVKPILEILILWIVFYRIFVFFEGTRSFQVLTGIIYIIGAFLVSQLLGFDTLNWLLTKLFGISIIAILIIFQQELRHGLARLGQQHLFNVGLEESEIIEIIEELTAAVFKMSQCGIGGIIAVERETKLKTYIESGLNIDAKVSAEMIVTIFTPQTPMHDGGIVIRGDRILASACLFPLSDNPSFSKVVGTRHRAALGLSEHTDAVILLISEETTEVSIAVDGKFIRIETREKLIATLKNLLVKPNKKKK